MSEYLDERIVSIKFDNSGFEEKVSDTQKSLDALNKSLKFDGASDGANELTKAFKEVSDEAKKTDLSPLGTAVENIGEKFNALGTIATGIFLKIGADAADLGKKLIKSVSIDPIASGFNKYQQILTSQMALTAALDVNGADIEENAERITDALSYLTTYADETSYSLTDMTSNLAKFVNYGVDIDIAADAITGIGNASAKSGQPLWKAAHAMDGFAKAMGQGYMSYQIWNRELKTAGITTMEFKTIMLETAKEFMRQGVKLSDNVRLSGDSLEYLASKAEGWKTITAESMDQSLTKGRWLTNNVMLAALAKYNVAFKDVIKVAEETGKSVTEILRSSEYQFDDFSKKAIEFAQQSKTLEDVTDSLADATSTAWATIFQSTIGTYEQSVELWSDLAEYIFEFFVYPLQEVADAINEFANTTSNVKNKVTGEFMTMREVIVDSFMNILAAISSVIKPIKDAFNVVFRPFDTMPEKLQNGVEKFHSFTEALILTEEKATKFRNTFITVFTIIQKVWNIIKIIVNGIKKIVQPIIEKVSGYVVKILTTIARALFKLISTISSFISRVFGVTDVVADIKDSVIEAAESIDELNDSLDRSGESFDAASMEYTSYGDVLQELIDNSEDASEAIDDLEESEKDLAKTTKKTTKEIEKSYAISGGYAGDRFLSYNEAMEKANHSMLASFIDQNKITEEQYNAMIDYIDKRQKGYEIYRSDIADLFKNDYETMIKFENLIEDGLQSYEVTARDIESIKNRGKDPVYEQYETVLDGIYKAQKETGIKKGDLDALITLYFDEGIKDINTLSEELGVEEWKVRELTKAYQEAADIENYLNKKRKNATSENIQLAREELGYIQKKKDEEQEQWYRGKAADDAKKRLEERKQNLQSRQNQRSASSEEPFKQSKDAMSKIADSFVDVGYYQKNKKELVTTKNSFSEVSDSADKTADSVENIGSVSKKAADNVKQSTKTMSGAFKVLSNDTSKSEKTILESIQNMEEASKKASEISINGNKSKSGKSSLADEVKTIFDEGSVSKIDSGISPVVEKIKDKALDIFESIKLAFATFLIYIKLEGKDKILKLFDSIKLAFAGLLIAGRLKFLDFKDKIVASFKKFISKDYSEHIEAIKSIWNKLSNDLKIVWEHLKNMSGQLALDINGFFDHPLESLKNVAKTIKATIKNIWNELVHGDDKQGVLGAQAILDPPKLFATLRENLKAGLEKLWEYIKNLISEQADKIRGNEDHPLHWLVTGLDDMFPKIQDFFNKLRKAFNKIKDFFKVIFGKGSFFDKLSSSSFWQPAVDAFINITDKIDALRSKIKELKTSIKTGITDAIKETNDQWAKHIETIHQWIDDIKNAFDLLAMDIIAVRNGLTVDESGEEISGPAKIIGTILAKWDSFVEAIKNGLDWDTIIKIEELEKVLGRLISVISSAWLKLNIAGMANDIGNFFSGIGKGIESLSKSVKKSNDIGKVLLEIAIAFAVLGGTFYILGGMQPEKVEVATKILETLAAALAVLFIVIGGFVSLMQRNSKLLGGAKSIPEGIANGLQNLLGNKNTMGQAAKLLVGIGAGLALMAKAFAIILDVTKDIDDPSKIQMAVEILIGISLIVVMLFGAIKVLLGAFTGSTGPGIKITKKEINKTVSPIAEIMKSLAILIGVILAAWIILQKSIDGFYTDGKFDVEKFTIVTTLFILIVGGVVLLAAGLAEVQKGLYKNESIEAISGFGTSISSIMKSIILGILAMTYAYKQLISAIDSAEDPEAWHKANLIMWSIFGAALVGMIVVALIAKYLSKNPVLDGDGKVLTDINKTMTSLIKVLAGLAAAIKILASAYASIISAIDTASDPEAWHKANMVMIVMLAAVILFVMECAIIAKRLNPGDIPIISTIANAILEIAFSFIILVAGLKMLVNMFENSKPDAVKAALITMGVYLGAILAIFGLIALFSKSLGGQMALEAAAGVFILLATGILMISASVLVLALGLQQLVKAMVMIGSANEEIIAGLNTIIDALPLLQEIISGVIIALVGGLIKGIAGSIETIVTTVVETFTRILEAIAENAPRIIEAIRAIGPILGALMSELIAALLQALNENMPALFELLNQILDWIINDLLPRLGKALVEFVHWLGFEIGPELIQALGNLWDQIHHLLVDTILPDIREFADVLIDTALGLVDDLLANLHEHTITWANELIDWIVDFIDTIATGVDKIGDAFNRLIIAVADQILENCKTGGKAFAKLILIPQAIADGFMDGIKEYFGLNTDGKATEGGIIMKLGQNIVQGLIDGLGKLGDAIKNAAKKIWELFKAAFTSKDAADEKSPSKAAYKLGAYVGEGLVNGINDSAEAVTDSAYNLSNSFMNPMKKNLKSFSAVTSSMLSDLIDADMDINPVITPVFDMTNLDYAASSMDRLFDSKNAVEVATSFHAMKLGQEMEKFNQNVGNSDTTPQAPTYNYTQNNYSPKALSPIEIYRRTHNQLKVAKNLEYGNAEGWVLAK